MNTKIKKFKTDLTAFCKSCGVDMYHNESLKSTRNYGIWYEMGGAYLFADDRTVEKEPIFSVQIWTQEEYSSLPGKLEEYFDDMNYVWALQTYADYDSAVQRYHYGWTVSMA